MNRGLLATREQLTDLRNRIRKHPFDAIYEVLRKRCALVLESHPVTERDWRAHHAQGMWGAALTAARTCQGRIYDLIISHHIDPNLAYRDRAIEEMKSLASWTAWVDPSHSGHEKADLCTAECCATIAVGLDWLEEDLSEADRLRCLHALRDRGIEPYRQAVAEGAWWYSCYHNWNAVVNSGCGLAALALADEEPNAFEALHTAIKGLHRFFNALGREGGWDEGIGYWGYAMRYLLLMAMAMDNVQDDRSIYRQRGMEATGLFAAYFSPRGHSMSFGDGPGVPLYGALYGFARRYGLRDVCWWLDSYAYHRDVSTTGWSDAGLGLLMRPADMERQTTCSLAPVKIFNEIGWASVCDHWPEPEMYVSVKTGDLSAHHSHLDMNAIQVQVDGETLLADLGNPPYTPGYYFTPERFEFYEVQAKSHNTLVVDDRDHLIDGQGQIVEAEQEEGYRWITANAGNALGDTVRFNRHVLMLLDPHSGRGETLIVLDEVSNAVSETIEASWHTFGSLKVDGETGAIIGRQSVLHFRLVSTEPFDLGVGHHRVGQSTESALSIKTGKVSRLVLAMVFAREPVGPCSIKQTSRGEVTLETPQAMIHFKGSRRHLKLTEIQAHTG